MDYYNEMPHPLPKTKEKEYIAAFQEGDLTARKKLIEHNQRLVVHIAKKYYNSNIELEELISIGHIGLIKAVDSYRTGKNTELSTYAARCINNEMLMALRANKKRQNDVTLSSIVNVDDKGNELTLEQSLCDETNIEEEIIQRLIVEHIEDALNLLNTREKKVIYLRYYEELTQREISNLLGCSRSYISRIEKKALIRLKNFFNNNTLSVQDINPQKHF